MTEDAKVEPLSARRARAKLVRYTEAGQAKLAELRPYFEEYVRWHRLVLDCEPDPEQVAMAWPKSDADG